MNKDWTGNSNSIYKTLGASNHTDKHRQQQDYYATEPKAVELLLEVETFNENIWEPACGEGHIAMVFEKRGYKVRATDLIDRGYGQQQDFLFFNDEMGRYWCYIEEQNDLGKSHYQWNCFYDNCDKNFRGEGFTYNVTHWMPLPEPPKQ